MAALVAVLVSVAAAAAVVRLLMKEMESLNPDNCMENDAHKRSAHSNDEFLQVQVLPSQGRVLLIYIGCCMLREKIGAAASPLMHTRTFPKCSSEPATGQPRVMVPSTLSHAGLEPLWFL